MQIKRAKRSRARAAKRTAGHGSKKKNRGAGHRGGKGASNSGKRGSAKIMKVTKGLKILGRHGFTSLNKKKKTINLQQLQETLSTLAAKGKITTEKDTYVINLTKLGYDKLLSKGSVSVKLNITVDSATESVVSKIEAAGGKVNLSSSDEKSEENK